MKLLPYPLDFIVHYPLKHYIRTLFGAAASTDVTYFVGQKATSILASDRKSGRAFFSEDVSHHHGAPNQDMLDPNTSDANNFRIDGDYYQDVNRRFNLARGGYGAMIFENSRLYDNLHSIQEATGTVGSMLSLFRTDAIREIITTWQATEAFEWSAFSRKLDPLPLSTDMRSIKSMFLAGIPEAQAQFNCEWATETGFILTTAVPLSVAVGNWAIRRGLTDVPYYFIIIPGTHKYRAFFINDGEVATYLQSPTEQFVAGELSAIIEETTLDNPECPNIPSYIWPTEGMDITRVCEQFKAVPLKNMIRIDDTLIQKVYGELSPGSPTAALCEWVASQAIPNHRPVELRPEPLVIGTN